MGNSDLRRSSLWVSVLLILALLLGGCQENGSQAQPESSPVLDLQFEPTVTPNTVRYTYRFGGEAITHYLDEVQSVTVYQRTGADRYDQVVLNLWDGRDYVLNEDLLVDYELLPGSAVEQLLEPDKLYHHYDPYLQGYKQDLHQTWVTEQYQEWAGRTPTEQEWLEALNELTRGVEHHQMAYWISYSPPAIEYFVDHRLSEIIGREPTRAEKDHVADLILQGMKYQELEQALAN
jgi:antirestriction protein